MSRQRLHALLEELARFREAHGNACVLNHASVVAQTQRMLFNICLIHGLSPESLLDSLNTGALWSKRRLGRPPSLAQQYLGTDRHVCTSAGVLYPDRSAALVFTSDVELDRVVEASPWDSGAFCKDLCPSLPLMPASDRRELVRRYSLPAPVWREYLVNYIATHFRCPLDYLACRRHRFQDALGAMTDSPFSRVFEVRIEDELALRPPGLAAIFVPRYSTSVDWGRLRRLLEPLRGQGVDVQFYDRYKESVADLARRWIQQRYTDEQDNPS